MTAYLVRRLIGMVPTLFLLLIAVSMLVRLAPGNPVDLMLQESLATPAQRMQLETELGVHKSLPAYLRDYLGDVGNGSFGHSLWDHKSVRSKVADRMLPTVELAVLALLISVVVGIPVGIVGAVRRNRPEDLISRTVVLSFLSIPTFVLATAVVLLPAVYFGRTPPLRYVALARDPIKNLQFFALPSLVLGAGLSASVARFMRTSMLDVFRADYIRTARSKGLAEILIIWRHVLKNALIPVVTILGVQTAAVLGGSVVIEQVFGIPGLGRLILDSIGTRDYPVVQGIALFLGVIVLFVNLIVDVSYVFLDHRIRYA